MTPTKPLHIIGPKLINGKHWYCVVEGEGPGIPWAFCEEYGKAERIQELLNEVVVEAPDFNKFHVCTFCSDQSMCVKAQWCRKKYR